MYCQSLGLNRCETMLNCTCATKHNRYTKKQIRTLLSIRSNAIKRSAVGGNLTHRLRSECLSNSFISAYHQSRNLKKKKKVTNDLLPASYFLVSSFLCECKLNISGLWTKRDIRGHPLEALGNTKHRCISPYYDILKTKQLIN